MRKKEFIKKLAEQFPEISEAEVGLASNAIFNALVESLKRDKRAEIRGFGTFYTSHRKTRFLHSPRIGRIIEIPEKRIPRFKAGKELKQRVNPTSPS